MPAPLHFSRVQHPTEQLGHGRIVRHEQSFACNLGQAASETSALSIFYPDASAHLSSAGAKRAVL
jgi:hypothetical protein